MDGNNPLKEVFGFVKQQGNQTLGDIASIERGTLKDENRPVGVCWVCAKFLDADLTEEPQYAKCCSGCDAYKGA